MKSIVGFFCFQIDFHLQYVELLQGLSKQGSGQKGVAEVFIKGRDAMKTQSVLAAREHTQML